MWNWPKKPYSSHGMRKWQGKPYLSYPSPGTCSRERPLILDRIFLVITAIPDSSRPYDFTSFWDCSLTSWAIATHWGLVMVRSKYYSGAFNGNQCRGLLKSLSRLQATLPDVILLDCLLVFNNVIAACFRKDFSMTIRIFLVSLVQRLTNMESPKLHQFMQ